MDLDAIPPRIGRSRATFLVAALSALGCLFAGLFPEPLEAQSLRPSRRSLERQNAQARAHDFTYLRNPTHVARFVQKGWLVPVVGGGNYELDEVSFPYARPEVKLFVERLARQYRRACGEKLVVTSLTRPRSHQPWNASPLTVHPTGMALDLRRSRNRSCRSWIESTLLYLEGRSVLEASRERLPPHYHVVLFPKPYQSYVENLTRRQVASHRVSSGENLWKIARRYSTSVDAIRDVNSLRSTRIHPGQVLKIPAGR